jgi:hypothetical protein
MKKILAATAVFMTLPFVFTSCGEDDAPNPTGKEHFETYDYGNNEADKDMDMDRVEDSVRDGVDDVESAADDVIDGAGDVVSDVLDGFDGDETTETSAKTDTTTHTLTTDRR